MDEDSNNTNDDTDTNDENIDETKIDENETIESEIVNSEENAVVINEALKVEAELDKSEIDEIGFNTGSKLYKVVPSEAFFDYDMGDTCYNDDGSYTINIPEDNPFFPYEVQFTKGDDVVTKWFMNPDDSVEFGGHIFYVSAYFDNETVTQMTFEFGGQKVIVYPEEKEFTDGEGVSETSLLPLETRTLSVDLEGYTPVELTMVKIDSVFTGEYELGEDDKVAWRINNRFTDTDEDYEIAHKGSFINLSKYTDRYAPAPSYFEMIVVDGDQLSLDNIRYMIKVGTTKSTEWLIPTVYIQDEEGNRTSVNLYSYRYYDNNYKETASLNIVAKNEVPRYDTSLYIGLNINGDVFDNVKYYKLRVYDGKYSNISEILDAKEITGKIWDVDMTAKDMGYKTVTGNTDNFITMVAFDDNNDVIGCLPIKISLSPSTSSYVDYTDNAYELGYTSESMGNYVYRDGISTLEYEMDINESLDTNITFWGNYFKDGSKKNVGDITAAYVGLYDSIEEATADGAKNIKQQLFGNTQNGYTIDCIDGVYFTVFIGEDGSEQEVYKNHITIELYNNYGTVNMVFNGIANVDDVYISIDNDDSYADYNFITMIVDEDTDLNNLAPKFSSKYNVYVAGSNTPEVSGESSYDFSEKPIQYTVSSEDGESEKNYWLRIVKPTSGKNIYINSLDDLDSKTTTKDGIIYTKREVMLDGYHENIHNILVVNLGKTNIKNIGVDLKSDVVELDSYWTFNGKNNLGTFNVVESKNSWYYDRTQYSDNLAKIALRAKNGVDDGTEITGTLTIKSGDNPLMVITLTGTVGDPVITTKEIPNAVKSASYSTSIENNNKYSWNQPTYSLVKGTLPKGMKLNNYGELYGVPKESGEFTFTIRMKNISTSSYSFSDSEKEFTLIVEENTNDNNSSSNNTGSGSNGNNEDSSNNNPGSGSDGNNEDSSNNNTGSDTNGNNEDSSSNNTDSDTNSNNDILSSNDSSNSSSNASMFNVATYDENTNVGTLENGRTYNQVNVSSDHILRASLLQKFYGKNTYLAAIFQPNFGIMIDMAQNPVLDKDIEITYNKAVIADLAPEFDTILVKSNMVSNFGFDAIFNFNVGEVYVNKKAYIYMLNDTATGYNLIDSSVVNSIGNVAFTVDKVTDFIILVEK
jgi:hypothetical protein